MLKRFPHCGSATLDLVLASISPKVGGWVKTFFVFVLMTSSTLGHTPIALQSLEKNLHLSLVLSNLVLSASVWWLDFSMELFPRKPEECI
jgi:hypothetical protein